MPAIAFQTVHALPSTTTLLKTSSLHPMQRSSESEYLQLHLPRRTIFLVARPFICCLLCSTRYHHVTTRDARAIRPLDGWEAVHHAPSGRWCYFNPATGVVSWDLDGVAANNERRSRPTSPQLPTSPQQSREEGSSARVPRQPGTPTKHQTAVVSKVGAASTARAAAEAYPHGRKPEPEPEPQPQAEVDVRKEHVGSGLPLPPDLSAAPIPSNNPGPAAPPSAIALHTKHEAEVGVKPESTDDRTPPVSVGDCCVLLRSALLRSEPSLSSPEVERLAAESRIRVLEVARCWRFPLPGHPVWRMRVGLVDESVPNENGSVADGTEVLPVSLGWISMKTKAGDDMVRNEATKQVPDEQGVGAAAAVRPAQEQQLTPQLTSIAQPGRPTHPALQTSATNIAKRGALLTPSDRAQQKVAARMERIDRLAEQKEAEYEWQQVAHQSGKSYWYVRTGDAMRNHQCRLGIVAVVSHHQTALNKFSCW